MNFNANVRLLGLFSKNYLFLGMMRPVRSPLERRRLSYLLPAAKQWIAGTILNRRYIGGTSEVVRRRSGVNLCLILILKRTLTLGKPYGNLRVVLWLVIGISASFIHAFYRFKTENCDFSTNKCNMGNTGCGEEVLTLSHI